MPPARRALAGHLRREMSSAHLAGAPYRYPAQTDRLAAGGQQRHHRIAVRQLQAHPRAQPAGRHEPHRVVDPRTLRSARCRNHHKRPDAHPARRSGGLGAGAHSLHHAQETPRLFRRRTKPKAGVPGSFRPGFRQPEGNPALSVQLVIREARALPEVPDELPLRPAVPVDYPGCWSSACSRSRRATRSFPCASPSRRPVAWTTCRRDSPCRRPPCIACLSPGKRGMNPPIVTGAASPSLARR